MKTLIKFENQKLNELRSNLLKDLSREYYAILYGKMNKLDDDNCIITVKDIKYYQCKYNDQTIVSINIDTEFRGYCLNEIDSRLDVDTIIDVHTHPFASGMPYFSSVDTADERNMKNYLISKGNEIHYASIVFSQDMYNARLWEFDGKKTCYENAFIKTQKISENIPNVFLHSKLSNEESQMEMFNRSLLALGVDTLKSMMSNQTITIVGVGGVGSLIAENLIHMGFQNINLIDFDEVEFSNLNRLVGATYDDAVNKRKKVDVVRRHLKSINPFAKVKAFDNSVFDRKIEKVIAFSDWIFLTTDNYASCVRVQEMAFKYYVPFISAATNILVENDKITDVRGEVILVRIGDHLCLNCLGKINKKELIYETHPDSRIREAMVQKGYVKGHDVKDPAVKTLNSMVSTIATDVLINQYTERQNDQYVIEFENNDCPIIYSDEDCVKKRNLRCHICGGNSE